MSLKVLKRCAAIGSQEYGLSRTITEKFIYAKAFVFALDNIQKLLDVISKEEGSPEGIKSIKSNFDKYFPHLLGVRNSIHHQEERIRLLDRKKKIIKPKTAKIGEVTFKGIYFSHYIENNKYMFTTDAGDLGTVEISEQSLKFTKDCIQRTIDSYMWTGQPKVYPI